MSIAEPQIPSLQIVAEQFRAEIFAYIQGKVGDPATADDLTQETFVKVGRSLAKGTTPNIFAAGFIKLPAIRLSISSQNRSALCLWKIRLSTAKRVNRRVMTPVIPNFANSSSPILSRSLKPCQRKIVKHLR